MRLWSIHPSYLDRAGLIALWREGLLAQKVLMGQTKGYKNHPQLDRFKKHSNASRTIKSYLQYVAYEANFNRNYNFDIAKIQPLPYSDYTITVTAGQLGYEFQHLLKKLKERDPDRYEMLKNISNIQAHPVFVVIEGGIAEWEKV